MCAEHEVIITNSLIKMLAPAGITSSGLAQAFMRPVPRFPLALHQHHCKTSSLVHCVMIPLWSEAFLKNKFALNSVFQNDPPDVASHREEEQIRLMDVQALAILFHSCSSWNTGSLVADMHLPSSLRALISVWKWEMKPFYGCEAITAACILCIFAVFKCIKLTRQCSAGEFLAIKMLVVIGCCSVM